MKTLLKYWGPVAVWMMLIFTASGDAASGEHSSRILGPLLHWLFPGMSPESLDTTILLARKCAHVTEFGVLALLIWRALERPQWRMPRPWNWARAGLALLIAALYAGSDELHQAFVPNREAAWRDVAIDLAGAAAALLLLRWWVRRRIRRRSAAVPHLPGGKL